MEKDELDDCLGVSKCRARKVHSFSGIEFKSYTSARRNKNARGQDWNYGFEPNIETKLLIPLKNCELYHRAENVLSGTVAHFWKGLLEALYGWEGTSPHKPFELPAPGRTPKQCCFRLLFRVEASVKPENVVQNAPSPGLSSAQLQIRRHGSF